MNGCVSCTVPDRSRVSTPASYLGATLCVKDGMKNARAAGSLVRSAGSRAARNPMDAILNILGATRLSGGIFLEAEFTAPWCVTARVTAEDCAPVVPQPAGIIAYHYVSAGTLLLKVEDEPPVTAERGDLLVLPRNEHHRLGSTLNLRAVSADRLIHPTANSGLARIVHGGGGECTRVLCGFLGTESPDDPILRILPAVLKIRVSESASGDWIESSLKFAAAELAAGIMTSPVVLARLAELLFMEAVRRYVATLPADSAGWRAGMGDPMVGRALGLLHSRMARRWTAEELARAVGMSRSAFAERFTRIMGEPPMRYLSHQRLQAAARRLVNSSDGLASIAFEIGYESEAAFNRAFKRAFGMPPAGWRKQRLRQANPASEP